ncbi:sirohydrochlorin chelatase [Corynebacterium heidelbergense]|uniref:Sirohydrochlorin chelatase n=1 Tax=Corynebacterium heidelbergense TaxID=2055947 RepID=A0A364V6P3_9CORY|nr:CbiX/SirB N-terminal domain-containing protein [Corynebacterium heidelbergense]RAV32312.1 hypothetical protein DLJ54_03975 [Corynebacterium heidelbergense]
MSRAIIVLGHGSRHPLAEHTVARIAAAVDGEYAMLDFSAHTLTNAAMLLAARGSRQAAVVPLLFTDAYHLNHDVPEAAAEAQEASGVDLQVTPGLGTGAEMERLLGQVIGDLQDARPQRFTNIALYAVGSSTPGANDSVRDLAARVGARAVFATGAAPKGVAALEGFDAVIPLFVAEGVLWDSVVRAGLPAVLGEPLGERVAGIVRRRAEQPGPVAVGREHVA